MIQFDRPPYIEGVPMEEIRLRYSRWVREEAASQVSAQLRKELEKR